MRSRTGSPGRGRQVLERQGLVALADGPVGGDVEFDLADVVLVFDRVERLAVAGLADQLLGGGVASARPGGVEHRGRQGVGGDVLVGVQQRAVGGDLDAPLAFAGNQFDPPHRPAVLVLEVGASDLGAAEAFAEGPDEFLGGRSPFGLLGLLLRGDRRGGCDPHRRDPCRRPCPCRRHNSPSACCNTRPASASRLGSGRLTSGFCHGSGEPTVSRG
jgi:hypothetical protein